MDLLVSITQLLKDFVEVDVLENLQVTHLTLELVDSLGLTGFVLLQPRLLVVEVLQLSVQFLDEPLVVSQVLLGQLEFLPGDLLPLFCLSKLVPQVLIL